MTDFNAGHPANGARLETPAVNPPGRKLYRGDGAGQPLPCGWIRVRRATPDQPAHAGAGCNTDASQPMSHYLFRRHSRDRFILSRRAARATIPVLLACLLAGCVAGTIQQRPSNTGPSGPVLPLLIAEHAAAAIVPPSAATEPHTAGQDTAPPEPAGPALDPVPDTGADLRWTVRAGETVMQTLRRWGNRAGIAVFWDACPDRPNRNCIDWRNQTSDDHAGSFDTALTWLLRGHGTAEPRPIALRASNDAVRILADGDLARQP